MVADVRIGSKTCLIMDEVDGMSAGDRGGVGALNVLIKKTRVSVEPVNAISDVSLMTQIPLILICNDRTLQKMKPLQSTTFNMSFRRYVLVQGLVGTGLYADNPDLSRMRSDHVSCRSSLSTSSS